VIELLGISTAVGMDGLGVSVGMGTRGSWTRSGQIRAALIFGGFEAGMPLIGLLLGQGVAGPIGSLTGPIAAVLLVALGLYGLVEKEGGARTGLLLPALLVSIDNLAVGLALGLHHVNIPLAVATFAVVSIGLAYAGLRFGRFIGSKSEHAGKVGAVALIVVGVLIGTGVMG
jgi:manganese efflux pump family protein